MPVQPPPGQPWWDVCNPVYGKNRPSACGGVNLGGHGDPSSPGGYRQDYSVPLEEGTDVPSPVNGIVLPQHSSGYLSLFGRQDWGGETDILTNLPQYGTDPVVVTILHYDGLDSNLRGGAVVTKGQSLGLSGGQTSGGHWPANPKDSTGPHVGVAVRPYDTWHGYKDPTTLMQDLWGNTDKSTYPTVAQLRRKEFIDLTTYEYTSSGNNGFQLSNPFDPLGKFVSFFTDLTNWSRLGKIIAGGLLVVIGLIATIFGPAAPEIASAVAGPEAGPAVQATLAGRGRRKIARAIIAGKGAQRGARITRERQATAQAQAEERVAEKTSERTAERIGVHEPMTRAGRIPRGSGPGGALTFAEQRRYYGGTRRYENLPPGKGGKAKTQAPEKRTKFGLRAISPETQAAIKRKEEREAREADREHQRRRGRQILREGRQNLEGK